MEPEDSLPHSQVHY